MHTRRVPAETANHEHNHVGWVFDYRKRKRVFHLGGTRIFMLLRKPKHTLGDAQPHDVDRNRLFRIAATSVGMCSVSVLLLCGIRACYCFDSS